MRIAIAALGFVGLFAMSQAASACDMEGFGFTRMNPFAQHAAWNIPSDEQSKPQDQAASTAQDAAPEQKSQQANAATPPSGDQKQAFTPVSASATAIQSQRFTATKD